MVPKAGHLHASTSFALDAGVQGIAAMEAGKWPEAASNLGSALSQHKSGSKEATRAAVYLAAVLLLEVWHLVSFASFKVWGVRLDVISVCI